MSHGPSGGDGIKAEPNLIPLLDLVMQLIMFFMMCVNFVTEQNNEGIELPVAQSARPLDENVMTDILFLNLNRKGQLEVVGEDPKDNLSQIGQYLKQQYQDAQRLAKDRGQDKVSTLVIIRADRNVDYEMVFKVMEKCKEVKYRNIQLRVNKTT